MYRVYDPFSLAQFGLLEIVVQYLNICVCLTLQGYVDKDTLTILDLLVSTITMYIYWCMAWLNGLYQTERLKDSVCSKTILNAIPYQSGILILE